MLPRGDGVQNEDHDKVGKKYRHGDVNTTKTNFNDCCSGNSLPVVDLVVSGVPTQCVCAQGPGGICR